MDWSKFILYFYPNIKAYFENLISKKECHHAYLFIGHVDLGIFRVVREIALQIITEGLDNTYRQKMIQQFNKGVYPDLYILKREINEKTKKVNQNISIEQVRELKDKVLHKSFLNLPKIIIIKEVERLNKDSANALLKILEEPPANTYFFLLTDNLDGLLETISSRCQSIRFYQQPINKVRDYLLEEYKLDSALATNLAHLSAGLVERAIDYVEDNEKYKSDIEYIDQILNLFDEIISDKFANLRELIPNKLKDYNKQKQLSERFLDLLEIIFRDMLLIKQNLDSLLYLELRYSKIKELSEKYSQTEITILINKLHEIRKSLDQNLNIYLILENLLLSL